MSAPDLQSKRVVVVGLGKSGLGAALLLARQGATVVANDRRSEDELGETAKALREAGVELRLGAHDAALFASVDHIVVSPGVPRLAELDAAEEAGVRISSEVELASWFFEGTVVGVTGTNGKSTVTSLLGAMAKHDPRPTFIGGNLGTPLTDAVGTDAARPGGLIVVELSSYQLERVRDFRAHVAVLLNVTDDHLDRYDSFGAYAAAKGNIFAGQRKGDHAIVPAGDALSESLARSGAGRLHRFGPGSKTCVVEVEGRRVLQNVALGITVPVDELSIVGEHNFANAAAAVIAAHAAGIPKSAIEAGLREFHGLPHRMQALGEVRGVRFFDDSKATNVGATVAALESFAAEPGRVVLIAGGKDKGGSYAPMKKALQSVGRAVITLGEAAELIERELAGSVPFQRAGTMAQAVRDALEAAEPGDAVLLAPACSSFDMYGSFAERGDDFARAVSALKEAS